MTTATLTHPTAASATAVSGRPLGVLIADDHPLFRRGIARAIRRDPHLELVGEAVDGREAISIVAALDPDVAVLDHRMKGLSGVEVCDRIRRRPDPPATAFLLLSAFEDAEIVRVAAAGGAAGYLGKTASQGEICAAIERVGHGGRAYPATGDDLEGWVTA